MEKLPDKIYKMATKRFLIAFLGAWLIMIGANYLFWDSIYSIVKLGFLALIFGLSVYMIVFCLAIMDPVFSQKTAALRVQTFKKRLIPVKLILVLSGYLICFSLCLWLIISISFISFLEVLLGSAFIGLLGSLVCTGIIWLIIKNEKYSERAGSK